MKASALGELIDARAARRPIALVTRLHDGRQCLLGARQVAGELVLEQGELDEARARLAADRSGVLVSNDALFVRSYAPAPRLLVVGAVHIAQALAPMAATAGFETIVIDPRRSYATAERFPGVTLTGEWPDEALARLGLDAATALVTLAHDPKLDDPALAAAVQSDAFFIGALGSRRTHALRLERLSAMGLGERLSRIHAPVGLALGGRSPAEIAVSILAQVIQARYRAEPLVAAP